MMNTIDESKKNLNNYKKVIKNLKDELQNTKNAYQILRIESAQRTASLRSDYTILRETNEKLANHIFVLENDLQN